MRRWFNFGLALAGWSISAACSSENVPAVDGEGGSGGTRVLDAGSDASLDASATGGGGDGSGGTNSVPSPEAGPWVGTTSDGLELGFTVNAAGAIDSLVVYLRLASDTGECSGPAGARSSDYPISIDEGAFETRVEMLGSTIATDVSGRFAADGQSVTGTIAAYRGPYTVIACGRLDTGDGPILAAGTWMAEPGVLPCPWVDDGFCDEPEGTNICLQGTDSVDCEGDGSGSGGSSSVAGGAGGAGGAGSWTCSPSYFGSNDGCDCGCGVVDPDCATIYSSSCVFCDNIGSCSQGAGCPGTIDPTNNAACLDGGAGGAGGAGSGVPGAWSCSPGFYAANDGCDCGCGALDPDCVDALSTSCDFCDLVGSCAEGSDCPGPIDPDNNAVCL